MPEVTADQSLLPLGIFVEYSEMRGRQEVSTVVPIYHNDPGLGFRSRFRDSEFDKAVIE